MEIYGAIHLCLGNKKRFRKFILGQGKKIKHKDGKLEVCTGEKKQSELGGKSR